MFFQAPIIAALSLLCTFASVQALPTSEEVQLEPRQAGQPPSQDPFYDPPSGFAGKAAGSILRSRKLSGNNYPSAPISATYQILYRTNDAIDNAASAVTTVLIPSNADFNKHFSFQSAYDQSDIDCSPSYAFYPGSSSGISSTISGDVSGPISAALNRGYVVSVPDYEINAAWTDGLGAGHGVLDSIRAVLASGSAGTGVSSSAKTIIYGYSGGSQATEWATELQRSYAPDVNIVAASMGGLPVNISTTNMALNEGGAAGYIPASFVGLAKAYPEFSSALDADLKPSGASTFKSPLTSCSSSYLGTFANKDIYSTYLKSGVGFLSLPGPKAAIEKGAVMGQHGAPTGFPIYMFKGTADEIVPTIQETDNLVMGYCLAGSAITYVRHQGGTHSSTQQAGQGDALTFVFNIIDGGSGKSGCSTTTVDGSGNVISSSSTPGKATSSTAPSPKSTSKPSSTQSPPSSTSPTTVTMANPFGVGAGTKSAGLTGTGTGAGTGAGMSTNTAKTSTGAGSGTSTASSMKTTGTSEPTTTAGTAITGAAAATTTEAGSGAATTSLPPAGNAGTPVMALHGLIGPAMSLFLGLVLGVGLLW